VKIFLNEHFLLVTSARIKELILLGSHHDHQKRSPNYPNPDIFLCLSELLGMSHLFIKTLIVSEFK
jgi:hypothetical protein